MRGIFWHIENFFDTLVSFDVDYDWLASAILDDINDAMEKNMKNIEKNWDGDVDAVRADVVAQLLKDMNDEGTRSSRWEASALSKLYHEIYDEPLPKIS